MIRHCDRGSSAMSPSIGRLETSVTNHQSTLRDVKEERKFNLRRDLSLKSHIFKLLLCIHHMTVQSNSISAYSPAEHTADVCCWTRPSFSCFM